MRVTMKNTKIGDVVVCTVNTKNLVRGKKYKVLDMINGGFNCGLAVIGEHGKKITPPMSYFKREEE